MKPFELKNFQRVHDPVTFQPMIKGEIIVPCADGFELLNSTQGLSIESFNKEFHAHFSNEFENALSEYDNIVKTYHMCFEEDIYPNTPQHKEECIIIQRSWINIGISNTPTFKTFLGLPKGNQTTPTSIVLSKKEMLNVVNYPMLCKKYLQQGLDELKFNYYHESGYRYIPQDQTYAMYIRGCN